MKRLLIIALLTPVVGSAVFAEGRKPPVVPVPDSTVVRLHIAPVLHSVSGQVVLQDVWGRDDRIELHGNTSSREIVLTSGYGSPDGSVILPALEEGETYSAMRNLEFSYGWDAPQDVILGEGTVQRGVLEITLSHQSAYVQLSPGEVELEPLLTPYFSREKVVVPDEGLLVMLPPHSEELAAFVRDSTGVRSGILSAGDAGTCVPVTLSPDAWYAQPSAFMANSLHTKNLSTGTGYTPGEYSGITPLPDGRYALVHNGAKGGGIYLADIAFSEGHVTSASIGAAPGTTDAIEVRDPEGITYMPSSNTLWVSGEKDQKILEYDLQGYPTGRSMAVPSDFLPSELSTGNGFESLSYAAASDLMWTVTEEPLKRDFDWFPAGEGRRMLRLLAFDGQSLEAVRERFYAMDAPLYTPSSGDTYIHGVAELLAMDDGTLLVLEREVYVPGYNTSDKSSMLSMIAKAVSRVKLYLTDPGSSKEALLSKVLVASFYTAFPGPLSLLMGADPQLANFEGMCLGPVVDSHPTVLLVNDSEKGKGNSYARLQDYLKVMLF